MNLSTGIFLLTLAIGVYSNCGCLKCNPNLRVVSPPGSPIQVILKNSQDCCCTAPQPVPYTMQLPILPHCPIQKRLGFQVIPEKIRVQSLCSPPQRINYKFQIPILAPPPLLPPLNGRPDRIVLSPCSALQPQNIPGPTFAPLPCLCNNNPNAGVINPYRYERKNLVYNNLDLRQDKTNTFATNKQYFYYQKSTKVFPKEIIGKRLKRAINWKNFKTQEPQQQQEQPNKINFPRKVQSQPTCQCPNCKPKRSLLANKNQYFVKPQPKKVFKSFKFSSSPLAAKNLVKTFKKATALFTKWLINPTPLDPPELQFPNYAQKKSLPKNFLQSRNNGPRDASRSKSMQTKIRGAPQGKLKQIKSKSVKEASRSKVIQQKSNVQKEAFEKKLPKTKVDANLKLPLRLLLGKKLLNMTKIRPKRDLRSWRRNKNSRFLNVPDNNPTYTEDDYDGFEEPMKRALKPRLRNKNSPFLKISDTNPNYGEDDYEDRFEDDPTDYFDEMDDYEGPKDAYLKPFNFKHYLHPTSMIHFLNAPIRHLNHLHEVRSHIDPVVETIPKVAIASKNYIMDLVKNFGRRAFVVGSTFMKPFMSPRKFRKFRFKRSLLEEEVVNGSETKNYTIVSFLRKISTNFERENSQVVQESDDVEIKAIKTKIVDLQQQIKRLKNYDPLINKGIFEKLIDLEKNKRDFIQKWKNSLKNANLLESNEKNHLLSKLDILQNLKQDLLKEILKQLNKPQEILKSKLIKILVRFQKIQCLTKILYNSLDYENAHKYVELLEKLNLISSRTLEDVSIEIEKDKNDFLQSQIDLVQFLHKIIQSNDSEKIKREAKLLWEIKNIEKLQEISIREINKNIEGGFGIKQELKILFDLEKQLEDCLQKQNYLINN